MIRTWKKYRPLASVVLGILFNPLFASIVVSGQSINFKNYSVENGLPDRFVYTIQSDSWGLLWIGTGAGLTRFDGISFQNNILPDTLSTSFITSGVTDASGKVWFGFNDGHVIRFSGLGEPRFFNVREFSKSSINGFAEDPYGNMLVASQNGGVLRILKSGEVTDLNLDLTGITAIAVDHDRHLIIGTFNGLYIYKFTISADPPELIEEISSLNTVRIQSLLLDQESNRIIIGTQGSGVYSLRPSDNRQSELSRLSADASLNESNIQHIALDSQGNFWLATFGEGVIKLQKTTDGYQTVRYDQSNGLKSRNVRWVFEDFEKNIWFGTFGEGLILLQSEAMQFINLPEPVPGNNIRAIAKLGKTLFLGTDNGIFIREQGSGTDRVIGTHSGLPDDVVTCLTLDERNTLWIGTGKNGVYRMNPPYRRPVPFFTSANDLERRISDIKVYKNDIWVSTSNGLFHFSPSGRKLNHFTTFEGLPYNKINEILVDEEGTVWLTSTSDALYSIRPDGAVNRSLVVPNMGARNEFLSIYKDQAGGFWAGTYGNGLFYFDGDTVLNYSTVSGLLSNYCYSVVQDSEGDIWVGHRTGISRLDLSNNYIQTYTAQDGITGDVNLGASIIDHEGKLWFGTSSGVVTYDVHSERPQNIPPKASILALTISDQNYPVTEKLVLPYNKYRLRVDYIGLSYSDPDAVRYQYLLENYDDEWSVLTTNRFAYYPRLEDGKYTFRLKAYNAFGISNSDPVTVQIVIKRPFWKAWWFYLIVTIVIVTAVVMIIKIRERNHIKLQKYLQSELEKRTREVVIQKEELEVKNKEITDSINYAKRIQSSILPPVQRLKDVFPESFVYYLPRDIVSGDFYWWGKIDEERFLVVCADSTGHGVPGAFMSMIGSTLIKDVTNQSRYTSPSQLLSYLDKEITNALNQNLEAERSNDGMDIVICEINPRTRHLKFASAMRPIILLHQNEQFYIRGNRCAVGGEVLGEKVFDDQEYDLQKDDIIYLFSDGYPDQFGGPRGKKFKMVRLKNLIDDIYEKSMEEQWLHIKTNFETWKGDYEQVDDVLFMGIRLT